MTWRIEAKKVCEAATPAPWYADSGVSTRTAWSISAEKGPILWLDGSKNLELDQEQSDVEENIEFIENARTSLPKALELLDECEVAIAALVQMSLADSPVRENCREHPRCRDLASAVTLLTRLRGEG